MLRYEDLHHDPVAPFTRVVETLEGCVDQARLARAIAASSFGALRRLEDRGIFPETSGLARSGRFFRRGKPDFWHNVLSRRQTATVLQQHGEVMARLGYVLPDLREIFDS
ncbi:MAG TPA: sulfotransferase domain-containing protein [Pirellulales bacterium]|nr:sulfotransferase domain-containing protein [Pirellulales bacterium]